MSDETKTPDVLLVQGVKYVKANDSVKVPSFLVSERTMDLVRRFNWYASHDMTLAYSIELSLLFSDIANKKIEESTNRPFWKDAVAEILKIRKAVEKLYLADPTQRISLVLDRKRADRDYGKEEDPGKQEMSYRFTTLHEKGHALTMKFFAHETLANKERLLIKGPVSSAIRQICPGATKYESMYFKSHGSRSANAHSLPEFLADYYAVQGFLMLDSAHRNYVEEQISKGRRPYYAPIKEDIEKGIFFEAILKKMQHAFSLVASKPTSKKKINTDHRHGTGRRNTLREKMDEQEEKKTRGKRKPVDDRKSSGKRRPAMG